MTALGRDGLLAITAPVTEADIDGVGRVALRPLTARALHELTNAPGGLEGLSPEALASLISQTVVDPATGDPILSEQDAAHMVDTWPAGSVVDLVSAVTRVSGLDAEVEDLAGESPGTA